MGIFSKKKEPTDVVSNLSKMNDFKATSDHLVYLAQDEIIKERLIKINDMIKYMPPTKKSEMITVEQKIGNKLDDLKIALSGKGDIVKINNLLQDIDLLLIERKNKF